MKPIRFDLAINGARVRKLDELQDNFTVEILALHADGILLKWLRSRNHMDLVEQVEAIQPGPDADTLRQLCAIFDIDADDQVIAAILATPAAAPQAPSAEPDTAGYKEKYEAMVRWLDELKRKKLTISQDDYNQLSKAMLDIDRDNETVCVAFDDALFEKIEPAASNKSVGFLGFSISFVRLPYEQRGLSFRNFKKPGELVEAGQAIGEFYSSGHASIPGGGAVKVVAPVRGILERFADSDGDPSDMVFRLGQPICYICEDHDTDPTLKVVRP